MYYIIPYCGYFLRIMCMGVSNRWMDYGLGQWNGLWTAIRTDIHFVPRLFERETTTNKTCHMLQYKLKPVKTTAIRLCGYLTFILECSVTTKTFKVASNHRGSTNLEFVKTAKLFTFFSDGLSQHCRKYSLQFQRKSTAFLSAQVHGSTESSYL